MPTIAMRLPVSRLPTLLAAGLGVAAVSALGVVAVNTAKLAFDSPSTEAPVASVSATAIAPALEPFRLRDVAPEDAVAVNAELPVSTLPNPAARPFILDAGDTADRERALACLTSAIYYEAATEPLEGQRAVAQVVLNRVRHPTYPNSVCGVVYQGMERKTGCQFTFTCDGSLARAPMASFWNRASQVAEAALSGSVYAPVGWATHYHADWVVPYWSSSLVKAAVVGTHIFYRWTGGSGNGDAFGTRYAGVEPEVNKLRSASARTAVAAAQGARVHIFNLKQATPLGVGMPVAPTSGVSLQRAALRRYATGAAKGTASAAASRTGSGGAAIAASRRWTLTRGSP